jgi:toxin ParE1/3/4
VSDRPYRVRLSARAAKEIEAIGDYIAADSPENAARFVEGLLEQIQTLRFMPARCAKAREGTRRGVTLRQLLYEPYRIIFGVSDRAVTVYAVRHGARLPSEMFAEGLDQAKRGLLLGGDEALRARRNRRNKP